MDSKRAEHLSKKLTNLQILEMLKTARKEIVNWKVRSCVNRGITKGACWNILARDYDPHRRDNYLINKNLIWEFGDFLPKNIRFENKLKEPFHQEPDFSNF